MSSFYDISEFYSHAGGKEKSTYAKPQIVGAKETVTPPAKKLVIEMSPFQVSPGSYIHWYSPENKKYSGFLVKVDANFIVIATNKKYVFKVKTPEKVFTLKK